MMSWLMEDRWLVSSLHSDASRLNFSSTVSSVVLGGSWSTLGINPPQVHLPSSVPIHSSNCTRFQEMEHHPYLPSSLRINPAIASPVSACPCAVMCISLGQYSISPS